MERLPHPSYVRRTAALTYGLIAGGLVCLLVGNLVRFTPWATLETILNVGFAGALIALLVRWFVVGESAGCARCGNTLRADPSTVPGDPLTFTCVDCDVVWVAQTKDHV